MKRHNRNIRVYAENNGNRKGFNIYLVFSGQREYLTTHRHNGAIYGMLKDGVRLADLQRGVRERNLSTFCGCAVGVINAEQLRNNIRYLLLMIDEYIEEREQCA